MDSSSPPIGVLPRATIAVSHGTSPSPPAARAAPIRSAVIEFVLSGDINNLSNMKKVTKREKWLIKREK
jgi:hypothetical protein